MRSLCSSQRIEPAHYRETVKWRAVACSVLGSPQACEQFEKNSQDPVAAWLDTPSHTFKAPIGDALRTGGVLAICELLRMRPSATVASSLCQKMLQMSGHHQEARGVSARVPTQRQRSMHIEDVDWSSGSESQK